MQQRAMKKLFLRIAQVLVRHDARRNNDPPLDDYCICGAPKLPIKQRNPEASLNRNNGSQGPPLTT
jgi:hypothetical protein